MSSKRLPETPRTILAFAPNWLGDAAMCTPALRALHGRYPDAALTVVGRAGVCGLLRGLPWVDTFVEIDARLGLPGMAGLAGDLRRLGPDIAVVFPHSFRAALLAFMTGARIRAGYARQGRTFLLSHTLPPNMENGRIAPVYMAFEYLKLVETTLGCQGDGAGLELRAATEAIASVRAQLAGSGPLVGIAPGAAFGPSKCWPAERYAAVADQLYAQCGARCVMFTGPGEEDTRDAVLHHAESPIRCLDTVVSGIETLKAGISLLDLLICNDSGPRHIAIAFGVPTVCIMGPTSPRYTDSPYEKGKVLRLDGVCCSPCQAPVCESDHRCMTGITPEWVVSAATEILGPG